MSELDKILPLVQRPARYINHEINSHKPDMDNEISLCLCFPDIYEVGASNLGIEILYHMVNEKKTARCERAFAPDTDLEEILIKEKKELFSLESKTPLKNFDIVGFSLQCELVGTNIVNMLSLSGIPVFSRERGKNAPFIIGGGPAMANPEPFADFFDLFLIGDGEESLIKILEVYKKCKKNKISRENVLLHLSKIEGVYIPSFFDVAYNNDGTVMSVTPNRTNVSATITKTTVNLDKAFFHRKKIVPFVETVHNRLNIEVARGCIGRCRFCQASKYYRPWRTRNVDTVMKLVDEGIKNTGYEDVAFSSLSCTDYKDLEELLLETNKKYYKQNLTISLPSMRCNKFSLKVAEYINRSKKPTITFAPEAGSDRLRNVIGKYLSEVDIMDTLLTAHQMGWKTIKLYFMIGLPTETSEDIAAIKTLIDKIKANAKKLNFSITVSPFVPKAHTAFQWQPMFGAEYIKNTVNHLRDILPADIRAHNYRASIIEAFLARGDRRISSVIYNAWRKGLRFDQWSDKFNFETWIETIKESGLSLDFYVYRQRQTEEILPWEHINLGVSKEQLHKDFIEGISETGDISYNNIKDLGKLPENYSQPQQFVSNVTNRILLKFSRKGYVKYLSHLEQIDFMRRAIKRTGLPVAYTNGFSPQIKASFGPAISVGYESNCEYADLYLTEKTDINRIYEVFKEVLPEGYELSGVKYMPLRFPAIDRLVNVSEYIIKGVNLTQKQIDDFLNQDKILISKIKKDKQTVIDAKELIIEIKKIDDDTIKIMLRFFDGKNLKLDKILERLLNLRENEVKILYTKRNNLFIEGNGTIYEI